MKKIKLILNYTYVIAPVVFFLLFLFLFNLSSIKIDYTSLASVSITLAGFLFTALNIVAALPNNEFMKMLRSAKLSTNIYTALTATVICLIVCALFFLLKIFSNIIIAMFFTSLVETIVLTVYVHKITTYSNRSR